MSDSDGEMCLNLYQAPPAPSRKPRGGAINHSHLFEKATTSSSTLPAAPRSHSATTTSAAAQQLEEVDTSFSHGTNNKRQRQRGEQDPRAERKKTKLEVKAKRNETRLAQSQAQLETSKLTLASTLSGPKKMVKKHSKTTANGNTTNSHSASEVFSGHAFSSLSTLSPALVTAVEEGMDMEQLTHIQKATIPKLLQGVDVLMKAQTGSGKTLAFLIPVVQSLQAVEPRIPRSDGTHALIIAPTRELCVQIEDVLRGLLRPFHWLVSGCIMGGEKKKSQKARLRKGVTIVVATPGRLLDHLQTTEAFKVDRVRWLVLDEADRLLDLGFEKTISQLVALLDERKTSTTRRQSVLVSATLQQGVQRLADLSLTNPATIGFQTGSIEEERAAEEESGAAAPRNLSQHYIVVPCKQRLIALFAFLRWRMKRSKSKVVVFVCSCASAEFLHHLLQSATAPPEWDSTQGPKSLVNTQSFKLHGNLPQKERTDTFFAFCNADSGVLVCTDVAARGLDFPAVDWIVQFDTPGDPTDYVHRVGRTARINHSGDALVFLLPSEADYVDLLKAKNMTLHPLALQVVWDTLLAAQTHKRKGPKMKASALPQAADEMAQNLQYHFQRLVQANDELKKMAVDGFRTFVRAYATHTRETQTIFHVKKLHLGHLAKSFGLESAPSAFAPSGGKQSATPSKPKPARKRHRVQHNDGAPKHQRITFEEV